MQNLTSKINLDSSQFVDSLNKIINSLNELNNKLSNVNFNKTFQQTGNIKEVGNDIDTIGDKLENTQAKANVFSKAFVGAFAFNQIRDSVMAVTDSLSTLTQGFVGLDTATARIKTLGGEAAKIAPTLESQAIELSKRMPFLASEIQTATYDALSAGVTGPIDKFTETAAKLATGGQEQIGNTVNLLSSILNAYGQSADQAANYSDKLFNTVNAGKVTIPELNASLQNVIPTAAAAGVSLDNIGGALALMTSNGIPAAQSTTKLNQLLIEIQKPGKNLEEVLKKAGVSLETLGNEDLPSQMSRIKQALTDMGLSANQAFGSSESAAAFNVLSKDLNKFNAQLDAVRNTTGSTEEAYTVMSKTIENQTKAQRTAFDAYTISFIKGMGSVGVAGVTAVNVLKDFQQPIAALAGIGAISKDVTGLATSFLKYLIPSLFTTTTASVAATPAIAATGVAGATAGTVASTGAVGFGALAASVWAALTPLLPFIAAIAAVGVAVYALAGGFSKSTDELMKENEEQQKSLKTSEDSLNTRKKQLESENQLITKYKELVSTNQRTKEQEQELNDIRTKLADKYPKIITGAKNYNEEIKKLETISHDTTEKIKGLDKELDKIQKSQEKLSFDKLKLENKKIAESVESTIEDSVNTWADAGGRIQSKIGGFMDSIASAMSSSDAKDKLNKASQALYDDPKFADIPPDKKEQIIKSLQDMTDKRIETLKKADKAYSEGRITYEEYNKAVTENTKVWQDNRSIIEKYQDIVYGVQDAIQLFGEKIYKWLINGIKDLATTVKNWLDKNFPEISKFIDKLISLAKKAKEFIDGIWNTITGKGNDKESDAVKKSIKSMIDEYQKSYDSIDNLAKRARQKQIQDKINESKALSDEDKKTLKNYLYNVGERVKANRESRNKEIEEEKKKNGAILNDKKENDKKEEDKNKDKTKVKKESRDKEISEEQKYLDSLFTLNQDYNDKLNKLRENENKSILSEKQQNINDQITLLNEYYAEQDKKLRSQGLSETEYSNKSIELEQEKTNKLIELYNQQKKAKIESTLGFQIGAIAGEEVTVESIKKASETKTNIELKADIEKYNAAKINFEKHQTELQQLIDKSSGEEKEKFINLKTEEYNIWQTTEQNFIELRKKTNIKNEQEINDEIKKIDDDTNKQQEKLKSDLEQKKYDLTLSRIQKELEAELDAIEKKINAEQEYVNKIAEIGRSANDAFSKAIESSNGDIVKSYIVMFNEIASKYTDISKTQYDAVRSTNSKIDSNNRKSSKLRIKIEEETASGNLEVATQLAIEKDKLDTETLKLQDDKLAASAEFRNSMISSFTANMTSLALQGELTWGKFSSMMLDMMNQTIMTFLPEIFGIAIAELGVIAGPIIAIGLIGTIQIMAAKARAAQKKLYGGLIEGGGIDVSGITTPGQKMLTINENKKPEFIVNARSTEKYLDLLQIINKGIDPSQLILSKIYNIQGNKGSFIGELYNKIDLVDSKSTTKFNELQKLIYVEKLNNNNNNNLNNILLEHKLDSVVKELRDIKSGQGKSYNKSAVSVEMEPIKISGNDLTSFMKKARKRSLKGF